MSGGETNAYDRFLNPKSRLDEETHQRRTAVATALRVNVIRLVVAIAISFKFHCRIAENASTGAALSRSQTLSIFFDMIRLKGLLYEHEFDIIQKASGLRFLAGND